MTCPLESARARGALLAICLSSFALVAVLVETGASAHMEAVVYAAVSSLATPAMTGFVRALTRLGSSALIAAQLLALLAFRKTRLRLGVPLCLTVLVSVACNSLLKLFFARTRPDILRLVHETGYSFPSGHSMNATALYAGTALYALRFLRPPLMWAIPAVTMTVTALVGMSRVYLGVHYFGDVVGGWLMGAAVVLGMSLALDALARHAGRWAWLRWLAPPPSPHGEAP